MNLDTYLTVDFLGAAEDQVVVDDDSGEGIFGLNAKLIYRAPHSGRFRIVVNDAGGSLGGTGGYLLRVTEAPLGAIPATIAPSLTTVESPFGTMALYESRRYPFSIEFPASWSAQPGETLGVTALFGGALGEQFGIVEEDAEALGVGEVILEEYVDAVLSVVETITPGLEIESRDQITTAQGLPAQVVVMSFFGGLAKGKRLFVLSEDRIGFSATYQAATEVFSALEPLINYSFSTFRIGEREATPDDVTSATAAFNDGFALVSEEQHEKAIELFDEAVRLNPGLAEAYLKRGGAYAVLGELDNALHDYSESIRLSPLQPNAYFVRGLLFILLGQYNEAVADLNQVIRLDPQNVQAYRFRGISHSYLEEFGLAIEDYTRAIELDSSLIEALGARGIIYWRLGQVENALTDFTSSIDLLPDDPSAYNTRALVHVSAGNLEQALADANRALELSPSAAYILDTRAYVYLKSADYENAKLDYEAIFAQGEEIIVAELGASVVYANLGDADKAKPLLQKWIEQARNFSDPDPQYADIIALAEQALARLE